MLPLTILTINCLVQHGEALGIAPLITPILGMAWDKVNPYSLDNQIKAVYSELKNIKTEIDKLEHAVVFGRDVKTVEYLIEKYKDIEGNGNEKDKWAQTALAFDDGGFDKSLTLLEEMMDGSSHLFAEGSIFQKLANDEESNVCEDIEGAWEYLSGLWVVGHAVWTRAYQIRKPLTYETFAEEKKSYAETKLRNFEVIKDLATPDHCHCYYQGLFLTHVDYIIGNKAPIQTGSATACQRQCVADSKCKFFTFVKSSQKCFRIANDDNEIYGKNIS